MPDLLRPASIEDLRAMVGTVLGPSNWRDLPQAAVTAFADLTGDHQWIHVDPKRAVAGPLGTTIVHGLFTLSLCPAMLEDLVSFEGFAHSVNYGYDRVRFPASVPTGSRVRLVATVLEMRDRENAADLVMHYEVEADGVDRPVCITDQIARFFESR